MWNLLAERAPPRNSHSKPRNTPRATAESHRPRMEGVRHFQGSLSSCLIRGARAQPHTDSHGNGDTERMIHGQTQQHRERLGSACVRETSPVQFKIILKIPSEANLLALQSKALLPPALEKRSRAPGQQSAGTRKPDCACRARVFNAVPYSCGRMPTL